MTINKHLYKRIFEAGARYALNAPEFDATAGFERWYTEELAKMREPDNAAMIDAKRPVRELGLTQFAIDRQRREEHRKTRRSIIGDNDGPWEITDE